MALNKMKSIAISQRRDPVAGRDETRDSMDVRIAKIFFDMGFLPIPLCSGLHDTEGYIEAIQPDAILINSGNDLGEHPERDLLETRLLDYASQHKTPVLAICRGTQMLNNYCGGSLEAIQGHVATRHKLLGELAEKYAYDTVNSYHNFAITEHSIGKELKAVAHTQDGVIKAIQHQTLPWLGIMWHPEREAKLPPQDRQLIQDFLNSGMKL